MARKTVDVIVNDPTSRDNGRHYLLTEASASASEWWAARCFKALAKSGAEVPEDVRGAGMAGLAILGFQMLAGLDNAEAKALMDEMMTCVAFCYDPANAAAVRPLMEIDVEEVATRLRLRSEVFTLHTGFSLADVPSMLTSAKPPA